ncbi:MAG: hypothetical protein S4CHLAM20_01170 [Chlamydiia bacterium]|nr:hypothetical protein [Chlamydiia bacterium]
MYILNIICFILVEVAGINAGLIGFFNYDFLNMIFGGTSTGVYSAVCRIFFCVVGVAAVWCLNFFGRSSCFGGTSNTGS